MFGSLDDVQHDQVRLFQQAALLLGHLLEGIMRIGGLLAMEIQHQPTKKTIEFISEFTLLSATNV